jgi:hypothetical protein
MMCSWGLSMWAASLLLLGPHNETVWTWHIQTVSSVVQADRHPPEPHCTEHHESELGCTGNEPYSCSKPQCSSGYRLAFYASFINAMANSED